MTHDFRPGDVVEFRYNPLRGILQDTPYREVITGVGDSHVFVRGGLFGGLGVPVSALTLITKAPAPAPTEHPSRARAASSLRAASASLTTAIDHLTKAGQPETVAGQSNTRIRTASEETQACIQHATMAMYWMLHERLGS